MPTEEKIQKDMYYERQIFDKVIEQQNRFIENQGYKVYTNGNLSTDTVIMDVGRHKTLYKGNNHFEVIGEFSIEIVVEEWINIIIAKLV